ncbi:MAG: 1-acyl-sn-glycerol-3-phosphate acyltransferase [Prochloraceae cyanobacterium]
MDYAQPKLKFIPPQFNLLITKIVHYCLGIILRFRLNSSLIAGITEIEVENVETLVDLYSRFQAGKVRLTIAVRHSELDDPFLTLYLVSRILPRKARQMGVKLKGPIHSHFVYDRGIALWGGKWLGWLFSKMGGIPVRRGNSRDLKAMRTLRDILVNGQFPLGVAPEGGINGYSERVSALEPGTAQLAFWCAEDLQKADRDEEVYVLPLGIQYTYLDPDWEKIDELLSELEAKSGLKSDLRKSDFEEPEKFYYQRLFEIGEHLLKQMEDFYQNFYHRKLARPIQEEAITPNQILNERLQILLNEALQVAEEFFALKGRGSIIERCRTLEEAAWNCIYREDIEDFDKLSAVERNLANLVATEAKLRMQHMRLVENFANFKATYVLEKPSFDRFAETSLLLFSSIARIQGDKAPARPQLAKRKAKLIVTEPISVTQRLSTYQQNRRAAKQAVLDLTEDIKKSLKNTIA